MTNEQKFKTAEERVKAFKKLCSTHMCSTCPSKGDTCYECAFSWLALEADEEKPMPCPFCDKTVREILTIAGGVFIDCKCGYQSEVAVGGTPQELKIKAIAAHNRVCRAVKAFKESEATK